MHIEGVFTGDLAASLFPPAVLYQSPSLWLLEYIPETQRHLENLLRKAERLPILSEACPSLPKYHFTLTRAGRFYVALDPLPGIHMETGVLAEEELIRAFERLVKDWKVFGMHVRTS